MNDSELLELCDKVYEIHPDWNDAEWRLVPDENSKLGTKRIPLYTSDYLLPLLMPQTTIEFVLQSDGNVLLLWYPEPFKEATIYASSPLKALLKLVVALKEAGVEL